MLTTGTLEMLSADQVAATIEHERAHLRLRHHRAILLADVVAAVGWSGLLANYAYWVHRLAEMARRTAPQVGTEGVLQPPLCWRCARRRERKP